MTIMCHEVMTPSSDATLSSAAATACFNPAHSGGDLQQRRLQAVAAALLSVVSELGVITA
jgi:hypothetical protein